MGRRAWAVFAAAAIISLAIVFTVNGRRAETSQEQCAKPLSERVGGLVCPDTTGGAGSE